MSETFRGWRLIEREGPWYVTSSKGVSALICTYNEMSLPGDGDLSNKWIFSERQNKMKYDRKRSPGSKYDFTSPCILAVRAQHNIHNSTAVQQYNAPRRQRLAVCLFAAVAVCILF